MVISINIHGYLNQYSWLSQLISMVIAINIIGYLNQGNNEIGHLSRVRFVNLVRFDYFYTIAQTFVCQLDPPAIYINIVPYFLL